VLTHCFSASFVPPSASQPFQSLETLPPAFFYWTGLISNRRRFQVDNSDQGPLLPDKL
jgi:hypothetical protein